MLLTWCFICKTVIPLKTQIKTFYKTLSISFTNKLTHCYPNASQCGTKIQLETVWDSITEKKNSDEGASKSLLWWTSQKHRFCQLLKENWIWDINILQCEKFMGLWMPKERSRKQISNRKYCLRPSTLCNRKIPPPAFCSVLASPPWNQGNWWWITEMTL